ncbi:MAG: penicillin acylase family protein [Myxococcales bacterium]|nr:penicillin acylase family protein [Myxococcales bacterium]
MAWLTDPLASALTIDGDGALRIERDEHGIPHIHAQWDTDLVRGLGYCHVIDRGMQLLVTRALGQGRGCELLADDETMLGVDKFFRRLGLTQGLSAEVEKMPGDHKRLLTAYVDGINAALDSHGTPWELRLLPFKLEPWTREDCVLMTRVIAYVNLAQSQGEMERLLVELVQAGISRDLLDCLFPNQLNELDPWLLKKVTLGEKVIPEAVRWMSAIPSAVASNNWVISGSRTASGKPILSNDPHLEVNRLPAVWYEVVLELEDRWCVSATMPGLPAPLLSRTNDLAWGATYAFMDGTDSWVEECKDGRYRRVEGGRSEWREFDKRSELIKRAKKPNVTVVYYQNDHGVLDGDPNVPGHYLSTRWACATGTGGASLAAMLSLFHARGVRQGMTLLSHVETAWNWVLADSEGHIAYQMSGRMPLRRKGHTGLVPLPGWDPNHDWKGFVPPDRLPWVVDPDEGFVATANNDLNRYGRSRPINLPMGPYRADRIAEVLASRSDWTVDAVRRLQLDVKSAQAERFMAVLKPLLPDVPEAGELRDWDLGYDAKSRGATRFERFYRELLQSVFGEKFGPEVMNWLFDECSIVADFYWNFDQILLDADSIWYGEASQRSVWQEAAKRACQGACAPWGEGRGFMMSHLLLGGKLPRFAGFDVGPIVLEGGRGTVRQGQLYRSGGRLTSFAPSYRLVTDLAEPVANTALAGGPSDRRFSQLYKRGIAEWAAGELKAVKPTWRPLKPKA